ELSRSFCLRQSQLRQAIRRLVGRNMLRLSDVEHLKNGIVYVVGLVERSLGVPTGDFAVDVDHAAGVRDVVRRVQNSALLELIAVALLEELVVRPAGDDLDLELRDRLVVYDST